jgi:FhaA, N-terminal domain/FHA domain
MGIFARFEKKVEGAVNGVFARAFKGDVQPVEIAARLQRELDAEAKLMSRNKRLVPNEFSVHLSQHDHDKLAPYANTLNAELATQLRNHAREMGYVFNGPVKISFGLDSQLPTGRFTVTSEAVAGITPRAGRASETAINRAPLVLEVNGTRHPLQPPGLVIGRGSEADLRINDPGISRRHAEIRVNAAGPGLQIDIVDLDSTNGILVNGQRVRHAVLREGSRIEIGSTRMLIHTPAGR